MSTLTYLDSETITRLTEPRAPECPSLYPMTPMKERITVRTQPAMSPSHSARVAEAMVLSNLAFCKSKGDELGDEDTEEDESLDADDEKERSDDEGYGLGDEDHGLDDESQITMSDPLELGYEALRRHELVMGEDQVPSTFKVGQSSRIYIDILAYVPLAAPVQTLPSLEWSLGSLPVSPSSPVVPSSIALLVATLTTTISVDKDQFIEVGAKLELYGSILYDHAQRLDVLPPTLVADIDRDVKELYTSLVLVLEAWARHVDTRLVDMLQARYDDHRLIYDMLVQQAAMQHELREMKGRVTALEKERSRRE
uniref:Uncharacterized protein n=1 Tax=Tanacetum cinerariifolium TaxID=118510 RepID=A0A6L2J9D9_TANCI|nr:hypothetical protein [Tanacetum cinerariifolium]